METLFLVGGIALVVLILLVFVASRYRVAAPTEALVITGRKHRDSVSGQKVIIGGGTLVLPIVHQSQKISLESQTIKVSIRQVPSIDGISLNVDGVAVIKVNGTEDSVRAAAQRFGSNHAQIQQQAQETFAGALRSIVGQLTVKQIIHDRREFASKVVDAVKEVVDDQGLYLDSFVIQQVEDEGTYLRDLGRPEAAAIKQAADIAEANAHKISRQAQLTADREVAESEQELALRVAEIKTTTDKANAEADAVRPLNDARQQQIILAQRQEVEAANANVRQQQLDAEIRRPADAEKYRAERVAEASRMAAIAEAEADAESIRLRGEAEAGAILARGEAEAEAMRKRADAFNQYGPAAMLDTLSSVLPSIAKEVSAPMGNIKDLTVVSTDGASALTKSVTDNMAQLPKVLEGLTGVDFNALVSSFMQTQKPVASSTDSVNASTDARDGKVTIA